MRQALPLSHFYRPRPMTAPSPQQSPMPTAPKSDPVKMIMEIVKKKGAKEALSEILGAEGMTEAGNIAWNSGADAATNAAWNAAADEATLAAGENILPGAAQMGPTPAYIPAAVAISTILAGKAGLDMLNGKTPKGASGKFGRAQLGWATGGLSEVGNKIKKFAGFGGGNSKLEEQKREKLLEQGIDLGSDKAWEANEKFQKSRNEDDLLGENLIGAADFHAKIPGWGSMPREMQIGLANEAIKQKLVRERNGGIELKTDDMIMRKPEPTPMPRGGEVSNKSEPVMIKRSQTRSPGIGLDGKRIKY